MLNLGLVKPGSTLEIPFDSFAAATGASITMTGLAVTDIEVYKDGSMTQRSSDNGYALLDTDGIDLDGVTGIHGFTIDLADNSVAGFYAAGSRYFVVVSTITVDGQTVSFIACRFIIGLSDAVLNTTIATLSSQTSFTLTAGPAEDDALNGCLVCIHDVASAVQEGFAVVADYTGSTKTVTLVAGTTYTAAATDNISVFPPALVPTVLGRTLDIAATGEAGLDFSNVNDGTTGAVPILGIVDQGTAQSASSTGIVLRSAAAFDDSTLVGCIVAAFGSTQGYWQFRMITANLLSGDAVTVDAWTVTPSGTITYKIFGGAPASATLIPDVAVKKVLTTTLTETSTGYLAAGFKKLFDVATPVLTAASVNQTGDAYGKVNDGTFGLAALKALIDAIDDYVDTEVAAIKAKTDNLPSDPADASDVAAAFSTVNSTLSTIAGYIDTEVGAIKTQTDKLAFTNETGTNYVKSDIQLLKGTSDISADDRFDPDLP